MKASVDDHFNNRNELLHQDIGEGGGENKGSSGSNVSSGAGGSESGNGGGGSVEGSGLKKNFYDSEILSQEEIRSVLRTVDYEEVINFSDPPGHTPIQLSVLSRCPDYSKGRNYTAEPVLVVHSSSPSTELWPECDCPCAYTSSDSGFRGDGYVHVLPGGDNSRQSKCDHQYKVLYSMESAVNYPILNKDTFSRSGYDILATYELDSDVPAPYFSWEEYDFFRPLAEKTEKANMLVMISNCGGTNNRLQYIQEMGSKGISYDSYGRCLHNRDVEQGGPHFLSTKIHVQSKYKFSNVFENSNSKDYVTEKLFGSLVAGSVPIYMGDSNVAIFGPSQKSVISVHDFQSVADLVKFLKYLLSNETEYNSYLSWKEGVDKRWRAMVDLSSVHSWCRLCIRIADLNRWKYSYDEVFSPENPHYRDNVRAREGAQSSAIFVKARERGKYWLKALYLESKTYESLLSQIKKRFSGWIEIWDIYRIKRKITDAEQHYNNDTEVATLSSSSGEEIEIIFLDMLEGSPATKWDQLRWKYIKRAEEEKKKNE